MLALMKVLFWLLHPDPRSRATITDLQGDKWTNQPVGDTQLSFDAVFGQLQMMGFQGFWLGGGGDFCASTNEIW